MRPFNVKLIPVLLPALLVAALGAYLLLHSSTAGPGAADFPKNPSVLGTLSASTETSVTITLDGGKQKTFSLSTTTQVVTQAASGGVGKTLAQIAPGTLVMVQPHAPGSTVADQVSTLPGSAVSSQDPAGPPVVLAGSIVSTSTDSITINTDTDPRLRIALTKDTVILSNVLAGQKGRTLSDAPAGTYVQVAGIAGTQGVVAHSIQLLVPLVQ
jgi:hypothetical protein